jgi:spectinomycin phosphotransferase
VRSAPEDLAPASIAQALAEGWGLHAASMQYVPEGGGSHHWQVVDRWGQRHFVNVDDLDNKDWIADARDAVFHGLASALRTAATLRDEAGLTFVVSPIPTLDGDLLRRLDQRYAVSVNPYLAGRSFAFGPYTDPHLRDRALDMISALHAATPAVRGAAPLHTPGFAGRRDLDAFLVDPDRPWHAGPYAEPARRALASQTRELSQLVVGFDRIVDSTALLPTDLVITHGEPHPANLMAVDGSLFLIDWDTVALARPERDLSLIVPSPGDGLDRYQEATGRTVDPDVITLYRLRWYLDDLASAIRLFRNSHLDTADTRRWWDGLVPRLEQLPMWLGVLRP